MIDIDNKIKDYNDHIKCGAYESQLKWEEKYTVIKNEDILKYLSVWQKIELNATLASINQKRKEKNKEPNIYLVVNLEHPKIKEILALMNIDEIDVPLRNKEQK